MSLEQVVVRAPRVPPELLPPRFASSWTCEGHRSAWVSVTGELDVATAPELAQAIADAQAAAHLVVLDLDGLTFTDASGVHVITAAHRRARRTGGRLAITRAPRQARTVFALTGAAEELDFLDVP